LRQQLAKGLFLLRRKGDHRLAKILLNKLRVFAGLLMIALAVIGVLLPIMPTVPFLFAGVALLGRDHPAVRPFMDRFDRWRKSRRERSAIVPHREA
jgi:uncharacterized membrane protein YbaN (DUF454 family)